MSMETLKHNSAAVNQLEPGHKEFGMFFAGAGGRRRVLGPIETYFDGLFGRRPDGEKNHRVYESLLFSTPHSAEKHPEASQLVIDKVNAGENVRMFTHSMGTSEAIEVARGTEAIVPNFLKDHPGRISIRPYSPPLVENWRQGLAYSVRYAKVLFDEMARLPFFKSGFYRTIVSSTTMPPASEIIDQKRYKEGLRKAYRKRSHHDGTIPEQIYEAERDYLSLIEPEVREKVNTLDRKSAVLIDDDPVKNRRKLKRVGKKRARVTNKVITDIYDELKYADHFGDEVIDEPDKRWTWKGFKNMVSVARKTLLSGKMYRQFQDILDKGVVLEQIGLPEYDVLLNKKRIPEPLLAKAQIIYGTHTSPPVAQPEAFGH